MRALVAAAGALVAGCSTPHLVWQGLNVVDAGQTIHIARAPACYQETGPIAAAIMGRHPTETEAAVYMGLLAVGYGLLAGWLDRRYEESPEAWARPRAAFYAVTIAWKAWTVVENHGLGLRAFGAGC